MDNQGDYIFQCIRNILYRKLFTHRVNNRYNEIWEKIEDTIWDNVDEDIHGVHEPVYNNIKSEINAE